VAQNLDEAHDRELAHVSYESRVLRPQPVAPEAEDVDGTRALAQVPDELARVEIA